MSNKRNLFSLAVVGGVFLTIILAGVIGNVRTGNYIVLPIVFTAFGVCGLAIWLGHFRVRVLLRDRTPDRIIAHYHRSVRRIPHADAAAAYLSALAATFFGEFDRARKELELVDWSAAPPMYQGHRLYVLATIALLEDNDYPKSLQLARAARRLEEAEKGGGLQLIDDIIHLVADGSAEPATIARLDATARKQQGLMPGMCAWALALHYKRSNQPDLAGEYKQLLRLAVPYCAALKAATTADAS
ncbi:MAG: hypothetical protein M3N54_11955 [Acidobacteriota bacterium]|nr:hypothetical protein [Acidobacteriota bacterium]